MPWFGSHRGGQQPSDFSVLRKSPKELGKMQVSSRKPGDSVLLNIQPSDFQRGCARDYNLQGSHWMIKNHGGWGGVLERGMGHMVSVI